MLTWNVLLMQVLNGLQWGLLLFLLSAGLTLVFGIMNFVNLTHGSLYMMGGYFGAYAYSQTHSFWLACMAAVVGAAIVGVLLDKLVAASLYSRDHLDQVLATFGLILIFNELVRIVWGGNTSVVNPPEILTGSVAVFGLRYPLYRLMIIVVGLLVSGLLYFIIHRTRIGMLIRAGATNTKMVSALGVNIKRLNLIVFAAGALLAGLAGVLNAPISAIQPGMGEPILILALVVIVTGGIGSIKGAFYGALLIGMADMVGRAFLPIAMTEFFGRAAAQLTGPAIASMGIYLLMAIVLIARPQGLFGGRHA